MSNLSVRNLLSQQNVKAKFEEILKGRAASFTANLAVIVNNNAMLSKCDPMTVISGAVIAASLDLPLDPNLGFAALVPYGQSAQFQVMYKGLIQLAQRSGQYRTMGVTEIYEGQLISENPLTGEYDFDFSAKTSDSVVGYAAYFKLLNGFEKTEYWPVDKVQKHAKKYSKTYARNSGKWVDDFDAMAKKTVIKSLLSKWGVLSIEMQRAVAADQAVVKDLDGTELQYSDNDDSPAAFEVPETATAKRAGDGAAE